MTRSSLSRRRSSGRSTRPRSAVLSLIAANPRTAVGRIDWRSVTATQAKVLEYAVEVDRGGPHDDSRAARRSSAPEGWSPDHLLLAALVRCSIDSLTYHARRAGHEVVGVRARREGTITKRDVGRALCVRRRSRSRSTCSSTPRADDTDELIAKAERDCFVGASLTIKPDYTWRVA